MTNAIIWTHYSYNARRYSRPWVAMMTPDGRYDFKTRVGTYTGKDGEGGDLVVFDPVVDQVYGYGQKDYRKYSGTEIYWAKWDGEKFVPCDKLGRIAEAEEA